MIHWRNLLSELRVEWSDRGANRSAGEITIKCPMCGHLDPSRHMAINESTGAYYCFRNPQKHSGKSATFLLARLNVPASAIARLITAHSTGEIAQQVQKVYSPANWDRYEPAVKSPEILGYLKDRGFSEPSVLAQRFDMRYAPNGKYAKRVLLPIEQDGKIGFTGRAILPSMTPKYLTHESVQTAIYVPWESVHGVTVAAVLGLAFPPARIKKLVDLAQRTTNLVLVEGPFDAVKVAWSVKDLVISRGNSILIGLDSDQPVSTVYDVINELAQYLGRARIVRAQLPPTVKDPGELGVAECRTWISSYLNG